tara:strand:+ start:12 stop:785 length:774 start_codon:yes stop_codon:yes gene_type:complete
MSQKFKIEQLDIEIFDDKEDMGFAAANFVEQKINLAIADKGVAHIILATGTSQFSFLNALKKNDIDWNNVIVFHLDEYNGISDTHPASFRKYLKERILDEVNPRKIFLLNGDAVDIEKVMIEYTKALENHPIDVSCIGIGENGHIAFNDPPVAAFNDSKKVKIVDLDEDCRKQQLGEGWFPTLEDVPRQALTLTIPTILSAKSISCVVPDKRKSEAVKNALQAEISTACPATILRTHSDTKLFLDKWAADKLHYARS